MLRHLPHGYGSIPLPKPRPPVTDLTKLRMQLAHAENAKAKYRQQRDEAVRALAVAEAAAKQATRERDHFQREAWAAEKKRLHRMTHEVVDRSRHLAIVHELQSALAAVRDHLPVLEGDRFQGATVDTVRLTAAQVSVFKNVASVLAKRYAENKRR